MNPHYNEYFIVSSIGIKKVDCTFSVDSSKAVGSSVAVLLTFFEFRLLQLWLYVLSFCVPVSLVTLGRFAS